jgi:hypothetical protein
MLTFTSIVHIPAHVFFTSVDGGSVLLNTHTHTYFALEEVGVRFWDLLKDGNPLKEIHRMLLDEYEVGPAQLEQDLLELLNALLDNGLLEIVQA